MGIAILLYFTISKSHFITYVIPFYNTSSIQKLYYFTILLKYHFFKSKGKHKKQYFLFVLSHFFHSFLSLSCLTSLLLIWVWLCFGMCSSCGSWFVDREFVMWVFVGCDPVGFCWLWGSDLWVWPCSMASLSVWPWVVGVTVSVAKGHQLWLWCWVFCLGC